MKLSDIQSNQVKENMFDGVSAGGAALGQWMRRLGGDPTGDMPVKDRMAMDLFVKKLVSRAYAALDAEIKAGIVDPNAQASSTTTTAPSQTPTSAAPAKPSTAGAVKAQQVQKQTTQNINAYVQNVAKQLNAVADSKTKVALTKELVNFMADRKGYPEWENALGTAKQILARNKAGGNMLRALQSGQRVTESWKIDCINMLLEAVSLTWEDLGLTLIKESKNYIITENKFTRLNNIFESMLLTEAESISSWLSDWVTDYMSGDADLSAIKPQIDTLAIEFQNAYASRDKGKTALTKLANLVYVRALRAKKQPAQSMTSAGSTAPVSGSAQSNTAQIQKLLDVANKVLGDLKQKDPKAFQQYISAIQRP